MNYPEVLDGTRNAYWIKAIYKDENVAFRKYSLPFPWHQKMPPPRNNFMFFAPKELSPPDYCIYSVKGIFQEQWERPYKVWFADVKAPFLWLLIKRVPSFQSLSPELHGKCLYKAETYRR